MTDRTKRTIKNGEYSCPSFCFKKKYIYSYTIYIRVRVRIICNKQIMTTATNYKDDGTDDACARGPVTYEKRAAQNTTRMYVHTHGRTTTASYQPALSSSNTPLLRATRRFSSAASCTYRKSCATPAIPIASHRAVSHRRWYS